MQNAAEQLNAAYVHHREGRLQDAVAAYRAVLSESPGNPQALGGLGAALRASGDVDGAVLLLEQACRDHPDEPTLHNNLGNALGAAGQWLAAEAHYVRALELKPDYLEALGNLGNALGRLGDHASAAETYERAAAARPDLALFMYEAGKAWRRAGAPDRACAALERAMRVEPGRPDILNDYGNVLTDLDDLDAALRAFSEAVSRAPSFMEARFNRANTQRALARLEDALADYDAALALAPEHPEIRWNRSLTLLLSGEWVAGLKDYGWRWRRTGAPADPVAHLPRWDGAPMPDGHLLVASEQGYGDSLQFARYLPAAAARVGRISLSCPPTLAPLIARAFPAVDVTTSAPSTVTADVGTTLMDLFGLLWADAGMATTLGCYLAGEKPAAAPPNRIGVVWRGNPKQQEDRKRSLPLTALRSVLDVPGASFVSLQLGGGQEIEACGLAGRIGDPTATMTDFAATKDILRELDLVIGVDTAVMHLAGAVGKPAWLLLPTVPDWRWGMAGEATSWYPAHRLFRQTERGDWNAPVQAVVAALTAALER